MKKNNDIMINKEELILITDRELKKLKIVFDRLNFSNLKEKNNDLYNLISSYFYDLLYFYEKKDYVKAFELINYIWGYLDCLANLKIIEPDKEIKKWFKINQD
ncbi:MAG: DUF357 domain-containing protein [Nanoarchaeota archaeon]